MNQDEYFKYKERVNNWLKKAAVAQLIKELLSRVKIRRKK